jgi:outer membrane protein OmpA-like peptidoglycan-associated protein
VSAGRSIDRVPDVRPARRSERVPRLEDRAAERRADATDRRGGDDRAPRSVATHDERLRLGRGRPLDDDVRTRAEHSLGVDLRAVRVHDDDDARVATDALGAEALAAGPDIAFAPGRYDPHSPAGQRLLDHELTHVAEQARAGTAAIQRQPKPRGTGPGVRPPKEPFDVSDAPGSEDGHVLFDHDSIQAPAGFVETFAKLLAAHSGPVTVELHGYSSDDGDPAYNLNLSAHRAAVLQRSIANQLPLGSVVRLIAHGTTTHFGETPDLNRRVGIDLTDRVRLSELYGPLPGMPSRFGVPELTLDTRLLPSPTFIPKPTPDPTKETGPEPLVTWGTGKTPTVVPRVTWEPDDPKVLAPRVFGPGVIPPTGLNPGGAVPATGLNWGAIHGDARARGVTLGPAEEATIAQHYSFWLPLSRAAYRHVPLVSKFFDSGDDLQLTLTRSMLGLSLQGDHPTAFELWNRQYDDMRAKLGLPPAVTTPTLTKTWEF